MGVVKSKCGEERVGIVGALLQHTCITRIMCTHYRGRAGVLAFKGPYLCYYYYTYCE